MFLYRLKMTMWNWQYKMNPILNFNSSNRENEIRYEFVDDYFCRYRLSFTFCEIPIAMPFSASTAVVPLFADTAYARLLPCTVLRRRIVFILDDNCDGPSIECNGLIEIHRFWGFANKKRLRTAALPFILARHFSANGFRRFPAGRSSVEDSGLGFENTVDSPCDREHVAISTISLSRPTLKPPRNQAPTQPTITGGEERINPASLL